MEFESSVWVRIGDASLREVRTTEDAAEFLNDVPREGRGLLYHYAVDALAATRSGGAVPAARTAFSEFCAHNGILSHPNQG